MKHILKTILIISLSFSFIYAQSLDDIVKELSTPDLPNLTPKIAENRTTVWGKLKAGAKNTEDGWIFSTNNKHYYAEALFVLVDKEWLLNDFTISIFAGDAKCTSEYKSLAQKFTKVLGKPNASDNKEGGTGTFWQLKNNKEWGIWVAQVAKQHPKTRKTECSVKATLAFGADEYLSEDNNF